MPFNALKTMILSWALGQLIVMLAKYEDSIVEYVNKKVNIPRLDEEDEAKVYRSILRAIQMFVKGE